MPPRRTPLSRGAKQLARKTSIRAVGKAGGKPGKKATAGPKPLPAKVVALVRHRSGGLCEVGLECGGLAPAVERAHRMAKGTGGPGRKGRAVSNSPSNLLDACRRDHDRIDRAKVTDAYAWGYKIRHGIARPYEVPVLHAGYGWVLLDDRGGWRSVPDTVLTPSGLLPVVQITCSEYEYDTPGVLIKTLHRYGHLDCGGWSYDWSGELDAVLFCACGSDPFVVVLTDLPPETCS
ncbi:hypothetical protein [Sphaerimonospora thailandensis]|nr:hypothetical protein [Sphaerimonospora thailandensis]